MPFPDIRPIYPLLIPNGRYADVEIQCSRSRIRVHKVVLCGASTVFQGAIHPGLRGKRDQLDFHMYDWDSTARTIEWIYYGGYLTPSEKRLDALKSAAAEKGATAVESLDDATAEELKKADLQLHFGIFNIAKTFQIDALMQNERSNIFAMMGSAADIPMLVTYLNLLHKVANDDELMSFGALKVAGRLDQLIGNPDFESLWLPGSFYKTILDRCSHQNGSHDILTDTDDKNEQKEQQPPKKAAFYDSLVNLKL